MATPAYTMSQRASAEAHLARQHEWRYFWSAGVRYLNMTSGNSGHIYTLRADGRGCSCPAYVKGGHQCSHMLALQMAEDGENSRLGLAPEAEVQDALKQARQRALARFHEGGD